MTMYEYMTLFTSDFGDIKITHSPIIEENGVKKVIVNFKCVTEKGTNSATCVLPDYIWTEKVGFSDEAMELFEKLAHSNAHLLYKNAEQGGFNFS